MDLNMMNSGEQSQIDLTYLRDMSDGDEGFIKSMLESFLKTVPDILVNIETYNKEEKWNELAKEIHKLKPTLKYLGVDSLGDLMHTSEMNCKTQQNFDQIHRGVGEITKVTRSVLKQAELMIKS